MVAVLLNQNRSIVDCRIYKPRAYRERADYCLRVCWAVGLVLVLGL